MWRLCLALTFSAIAFGLDSARGQEANAELRRLRERLAELPAIFPSEQIHGRIGFYGRPADPAWVVLDLGETATPEEVVIFPARLPIDASAGESGQGFPPDLEVEISDDAAFAHAIRLGQWREMREGEGLDRPLLRIPGNGASGRYLRLNLRGGRLRPTGRGTFFTLGEIVVLARGHNLALRRPVTTSDSIENAPRWQSANLTDGYLWCLPLRGLDLNATNGYHSAIESREITDPKWVMLDLGTEQTLDAVHLVPAHPRDFADTAGFGFPPGLRLLAVNDAGEETTLFSTTGKDFPNPGATTVMIPAPGITARWLRVESGQLWRRTNDYLMAFAELQAWSGGRNLALGAPVTARDSTEQGLWSTSALTDGLSSRGELLPWSEWLDALTERADLESRALDLANEIEARRQILLRRWLGGSLGASLLIALGAAYLVSRQRRASERAQEELRQRIAGDLHDELGASLSHLALQSDLARARLPAGDPVQERLGALSETARETLDNMRDMVWLLAPATGDWEAFTARLENIAARLLDGLDHQFHTHGQPPGAAPSIEEAREVVLFLKEALSNIRRHARARRVEVSLTFDTDSLSLLIADDGCGFDPDAEKRPRGLGLPNLKQRAATLRGQCRIESRPGHGTRITLIAPHRP